MKPSGPNLGTEEYNGPEHILFWSVGILLYLIGHRYPPKGGVWKNRKLSPSPTLEYTVNLGEDKAPRSTYLVATPFSHRLRFNVLGVMKSLFFILRT